MGIASVLFHGDLEHLACGSAVDVASCGKDLLTPLLSGNPGYDAGFDGGKVGNIESASGFRNERRADKFGQDEGNGIVQHRNGVKPPVLDKRSHLF